MNAVLSLPSLFSPFSSLRKCTLWQWRQLWQTFASCSKGKPVGLFWFIVGRCWPHGESHCAHSQKAECWQLVFSLLFPLCSVWDPYHPWAPYIRVGLPTISNLSWNFPQTFPVVVFEVILDSGKLMVSINHPEYSKAVGCDGRLRCRQGPDYRFGELIGWFCRHCTTFCLLVS